jgi:hypothetical protein
MLPISTIEQDRGVLTLPGGVDGDIAGMDYEIGCLALIQAASGGECRVPRPRWVSEIWILCSEPSVAKHDPPRGVTCSRHIYEGRDRRKCDVVHTALKFSRSGDCDLDGPSPGVRTADALLSPSASRAEGTVAVIDVFRAFTTAAVALANGASRIVMVGGVEGAFALRDAGLGQVCMGEVGGRAPDGFDFGNSPFEILSVDFSCKTIIQRTSAGTRALARRPGRRNGFTPPPLSQPMRRCALCSAGRLIFVFP